MKEGKLFQVGNEMDFLSWRWGDGGVTDLSAMSSPAAVLGFKGSRGTHRGPPNSALGLVGEKGGDKRVRNYLDRTWERVEVQGHQLVFKADFP